MSAIPLNVVISVVAMLVLLRLSRSVAAIQPNRSRAFLSAALGVLVLAGNAIAGVLGIDTSAWQTPVTALAMLGMAVAGVFMVRAALRGEAVQLQQEAQRQAAQYRKTREAEQSDDQQ